MAISRFHFHAREGYRGLASDQKINRIVNAVVDGLEAKGFKVEDQDVKDIFAKVAKVINENSSK